MGYYEDHIWQEDKSGKEVNDPVSLANYIQRTTGTPFPTGQDMAIFRRKLKEFFAQYPHLDYQVFVKTTDWCKANKRRFARIHQVLDQYRWAWQAGALPEFDANPDRVLLTRELDEALAGERRQEWRNKLVFATSGACSLKQMTEVYEEWKLAKVS